MLIDANRVAEIRRAVMRASDLFALCDALNAAERETAEWRASPEFAPHQLSLIHI